MKGFVTACESDGHERVITGLTVRELLVGVDDEHRRLAYAVVDGFVDYQGTAQVVPADGGWMMALGAAAIRRTLTGH